jgi:hypothetical protein
MALLTARKINTGLRPTRSDNAPVSGVIRMTATAAMVDN